MNDLRNVTELEHVDENIHSASSKETLICPRPNCGKVVEPVANTRKKTSDLQKYNVTGNYAGIL